MADTKTADEWKTEGNDELKKGNLKKAIQCYSNGIELNPKSHVLFSNRSAAFCKNKQYKEALVDAEKTIELKPDWGKGYSRKGTALEYLGRFPEAEDTYRKGLEVDPANAQLKEGLEKCQEKKMADVNPFKALDAIERLKNNPKTSTFMADPKFVEGIKELGRDYKSLQNYMQDQRYLVALGVLLGVDIQSRGDKEDDPLVQNSKPAKSTTSKPPKDEPMEVDNEETKKEKEALGEKEKGNAAYKAKDFPTALAHYDKAIELDPKNITFLTNKAAVFFEQGEFDKCLATCEQAVEKGRETRADFKLIAKALARMGNVYLKQEKWKEAIRYYDKSLAEHRFPDTLAKKNEAQKKLKEEELKAYLDPEKSLEQKKLGNEAFQKGSYPEAIKCYTEAIKRNPDDAKIYSNRAACYIKLLEFPLAIKDCDQCIKLEPDFIKGHIRKGQAHLGLKEVSQAMSSYEKALSIDPNNQDAKEGLRRCSMDDSPEERRKRAMHDPEVREILGDPAMQMLLQQMQENPSAIRDHLKNPEIAAKLQKLMSSGVISFR